MKVIDTALKRSAHTQTKEAPFRKRNHASAVFFALCMGSAAFFTLPANAADNFDFVGIADESGSMSTYQRFVGTYALSLDQALKGQGAGTTRYGLVGFGSSSSGVTAATLRTVPVGGGTFGTATEFEAATRKLEISGATEDGYAAMSYALTNLGSQFSSGSKRNFLLVTDEDRDVVDSSINRSGMLTKLQQNNVIMTAIVNVRILAKDGSSLVAVAKDTNGTVIGYKSDGKGGVTKTEFGSFQNAYDTSVTDYATLALDSGGVVSDLSYISQGGASAQAVATALTQALLTVNAPVVVIVRDPLALSSAAQTQALDDTVPAGVRSSVRSVVSSVNNRLRDLRTGNGSFRAADMGNGGSSVFPVSGLSGGDSANVIGLWIDGNYTHLRNTSAAQGFRGHTNMLTIGADYGVTDRLVVGMALGFEAAHINTDNTNILRSSRGGTGTVYAGYLITDWLQAAAQASVNRANNDVSRNTTTRVTGDTLSTRSILGASLTAFDTFGDFSLSGTVGYNRGHERFNSYVSSDGAHVNGARTSLGQVQIGGEGAYNVEKGQFFLSATWEVDHIHAAGTDPNGAVLGAGMRLNLMDNLKLSFLGTAQVLRQDDRQLSISANLHYAF